MFDEPENPGGAPGSESARDPAQRAKEKADELRMHAELAAVFEGPRKFDAEVRPGLDVELARDVQRAVAKLEKAKKPETGPVLTDEASVADAARLLTLATARGLSTNDYHVHRRPGEAMIVRWLAGEQVESFYARMQAHFDFMLEGVREDEKSAHGWKQDDATAKYLEALDKVQEKLADRYLRDPIRKFGLFALSTVTADEMNIEFLCDHLMTRPAADVVGEQSAPEDGAGDGSKAWFFKLFSLRGIVENDERMLFFTFLQKADDFDF
jgi:hypothetical protein